jgi:ankyrin repeat protein
MNSIDVQLDRDGRSPLHIAAARGDRDEVVRLLDEGHSPNLGDKLGFTPLHLAAQESHLEVARSLLDNGAEVDARNRFGNTPLFVAVFNSRGSGDLIRLLRDRDADPLAENENHQTPLGLSRLIANYDVRQFFADL